VAWALKPGPAAPQRLPGAGPVAWAIVSAAPAQAAAMRPGKRRRRSLPGSAKGHQGNRCSTAAPPSGTDRPCLTSRLALPRCSRAWRTQFGLALWRPHQQQMSSGSRAAPLVALRATCGCPVPVDSRNKPPDLLGKHPAPARCAIPPPARAVAGGVAGQRQLRGRRLRWGHHPPARAGRSAPGRGSNSAGAGLSTQSVAGAKVLAQATTLSWSGARPW